MNISPSPELISWVVLIKNAALTVASLFTIGLGIYGISQWKRERRGTEALSIVKDLVAESHKLTVACMSLREPIQNFERKRFSREEIKHTTENERWKLSEQEAFDRRFKKFEMSNASYKKALLSARALLGSHIYSAFLDFGKHVTENVAAVNSYLDKTLSDSFIYYSPKQSELLSLQKQYLVDIGKPFDELAERTFDAREEGEKALLKYLGRKSIKG